MRNLGWVCVSAVCMCVLCVCVSHTEVPSLSTKQGYGETFIIYFNGSTITLDRQYSNAKAIRGQISRSSSS